MAQKPLRRVSLLVLRFGVAGLLLAVTGMAAIGFALFGCQGCQPTTPESRKVEGLVVNPPDPPLERKAK